MQLGPTIRIPRSRTNAVSRRSRSTPAPVRKRRAGAAAEPPAAAGRRIQVRKSGVHGKGVFALRPIAKGETVIEYTGEIIPRFYSLHMLLIPGGIIGLIGLHMYLVTRLGVTPAPWKTEDPANDPEAWS